MIPYFDQKLKCIFNKLCQACQTVNLIAWMHGTLYIVHEPNIIYDLLSHSILELTSNARIFDIR